MKLMLGCVSSIVPRAVARYPAAYIGIVASYSQAGVVSPGYSGLHAKRLADSLRKSGHEVWRDHASTVHGPEAGWSLRATVSGDIRAGLYGIMPDWSAPVAIDTIGQSHLKVEAGHGEDPNGDWRESLKICQHFGCEVTHVSAWLGTYLRKGSNTLDLSIAKRVMDELRESGLTVRAHNCDLLSESHLRHLRDLGVREFNFAPEVGLVLSQALKTSDPAMYAIAESMSKRDGRYRRWGNDPIYGVHYILSTLMHRLNEETVHTLEESLISWIDERFAWLYD